MSDLVSQELDRAVELLTQNGITRRLTADALRRHLEHLVARVASAARSEALVSIRSAEDAAEAWGVTPRRAQAHIARLHERKGVGARVGRAWLLTEQEIAANRPGPPGRPREEV